MEKKSLSLNEKLELLKSNISELKEAAVAFSGGVDSTFLLKVTHEVLGSKALAVTIKASMVPESEINYCRDFTKKYNIKHEIIEADFRDIRGFAENPKDRCYICKKHLFGLIVNKAAQYRIQNILDGSNVDDMGDYRPGMKALEELGIISPLRNAGMTKADVRLLSKEMGLETWNKPAYACLASRIPYGQEITENKLKMVYEAEKYLMDMGFKQVRVRHHGDMARIEVPSEDRARFYDMQLMDIINDKFREIGFVYTALDLKGYRTGSMNEAILRR
mgnify:CR=1 FL=1